MQTLAYLLPMIRHILAQPPLQARPDGRTSSGAGTDSLYPASALGWPHPRPHLRRD